MKSNQPRSHDICFFFILWEGESEETEYTEKEVDVNLRNGFHLNYAFSSDWKKLQVYLWSGSYAKEDQDLTDQKYKHRR